MKKTLLLDRSWVSRIALGGEMSTSLETMLDRFDVVALESGGASALNRALEQKDELRGKLYCLEATDFPVISEQDGAEMENRIRSFALKQRVANELRRFKAESGRFGGSDDAVIGYCYRLLMAANMMDAAILCWEPRFRVVSAILQEEGILEECVEGMTCLRTRATRFPLPEDHELPKHEIHIITCSVPREPGTFRKRSAVVTDGFKALSTQSGNVASECDSQALEQIHIGRMMTIAGDANQIFRPLTMFDHGIDGELEFKDDNGNASGKKIYVQLKNGEAHLRTRKSDGKEIYDIKNQRHLEYWVNQPVDVYLVILQPDHEAGQQVIRWMNVTDYLKNRKDKYSRQIVFSGDLLDKEAILNVRRFFFPIV